MSVYVLDHAVAAAKAAKEHTVARGGIGADLVPALHLYREEDFMGAFLFGGIERERGFTLISAVIALSDAPVVHHLHEAYREMSHFPGMESATAARESRLADYEYGSLAQRFAAGDQRVVEAVMVTVAPANGPMAAAFLPYRYHGRTVEWFDPLLFDESDEDHLIDGDLHDAIKLGFANRDGEAMSAERISSQLKLSAVFPTRPARNAPCPCGSGRKSKVCCWG
jgi:hypothetical protein